MPAVWAQAGAPGLAGSLCAGDSTAGRQRGRLCKVRHVAAFYRLSWTAVKRIDQRHLEQELGPVDLSGVTVIAMDEFAIQKGHRYATVIVEPSSKRVLWVCRGRSREDIRPFFELLGPEGRARLRAAVMDMNTAYDLEVRRRGRQ